MQVLQQATLRNRLLKSLAAEDFEALRPHLEPARLELRQILIKPGEPIEHLWFVERGYISLTADFNTSKIEVGLIGYEGLVGVSVLLGSDRIPFECLVQGAGDGLRVLASTVVALADERRSLRESFLRFAQVMVVQASATAVAHAEFSVESRLARWLLMCHDRVESDDVVMTHDFLSMMLGVRRAGVTTATHVLEGHGLIRAKRGVITIVDRQRLKELAAGSYGVPEAEYARLLQGNV